MKLSAATAVSNTADESLVYLADYDVNATTYDTKAISVDDLTTQIVASDQMASGLTSPFSLIQTLRTISSDLTVSQNASACSFDDVTIADGITLTISSPSTWSIDGSSGSTTASNDLLDEDNFVTNSATKAASQQSIKAYVDSEVTTITTALGLKAPAADPIFTGTVTLPDDTVTGAKIADDTITEAKLDVSNAPTDGHYLQAQSGEGGGLTWAAVSSGGLVNNSSKSGSLGVGTNALDSETSGAEKNTAIGDEALTSNTSGLKNTAIGYSSLTTNTEGDNNTAIGAHVLQSTSTGDNNTAVGFWAAYSNTTGSRNIAIGSLYPLYVNTTGNENIAIGPYALYSNTASGNIAIGYEAMKANTSGIRCMAIGYGALKANTTANDNEAIGNGALKVCTTGDENLSIGRDSGFYCTTGSSNVFIGRYAGYSTTTGTNNVCIGPSAISSSATAGSEFTLGSSGIQDLRCNATSISSLSDSRDKTDVVDLPVGLDFINALRPVKFKWETRDGNAKDDSVRAGFIAQELQSAQTDSEATYLDLVMDKNPERLEAKYGNLIPALVQAIKELSAQVEELQKT